MGKTRHAPEEILAKLRQADEALSAGVPIGEICQRLAISEATFHRWRKRYGGLKDEERKRLQELEAENTQLRKLVAEQALTIKILREALRGNSWTSDHRRTIVEHVRQTLGVSERRACEILGQPRSTQRYRPEKSGDGPEK